MAANEAAFFTFFFVVRAYPPGGAVAVCPPGTHADFLTLCAVQARPVFAALRKPVTVPAPGLDLRVEY